MEENLISFQTAKLAKEKGFNISTAYCFDTSIVDYKLGAIANPEFNWNTDTHDEDGELFSCPTQSLLQKWIRSKGIAVDVYSELYCQRFQFKVDMIALFELTPDNYSLHLPDAYTTYEFALEAGLIEALKLIP